MNKVIDNSTVIKNIERLLVERSMSKTDFYEKSNITSASYSQWNKNKSRPTAKLLKRAADTLGVSVTYLVTGDGGQVQLPDMLIATALDLGDRKQEIKTDIKKDPALSDEVYVNLQKHAKVAVIIEKMQSLSPENMEKALEFIEFLAAKEGDGK